MNIIFILSDQHNAKFLGHEGHPHVRTPNLDRMAAEGTRFPNCVCANPICTPSRTSFLSGQYPHNHGVYALSGPAPPGLPSLLSHARSHGFRTAAIGKTHCPEGWLEQHCDIFEDTCGTSVRGRSKEYERDLAEAGVLELEDHNQLPEYGERGRQSVDGRPSPLTFEQSQEGWVAHRSIAFMRDCQAQGHPFCLHASLPRPHQCTTPCMEYWDLYSGIDESWLPPNADWDLRGKSPALQKRSKRWREEPWPLLEPRDFDSARLRKLRGYLGAVSQVDAAVGRILDFLRSSGLDQDTVVVYSSDHGDYACEHGIMEKAPGICSDAVTRIPFIWWGAGVPAGEIQKGVVSATDTVQTLCSLAALPLMETADGIDLTPQLGRKASGDSERLGVTEFAWSKSIRRGNYRYVYYPESFFPELSPQGFGELYDLEADPWEMNNLYFDPAHRATVREFERSLLGWLITTTRPGGTLGANMMGHSVPESDQTREEFGQRVNADGKISPRYLPAAKDKNYL